jgi:hypothetical protein
MIQSLAIALWLLSLRLRTFFLIADVEWLRSTGRHVVSVIRRASRPASDDTKPRRAIPKPQYQPPDEENYWDDDDAPAYHRACAQEASRVIQPSLGSTPLLFRCNRFFFC